MTYKNPLTLEALQVIDCIERRESFAKAAEELNKVPSALSYIVQKLEEQLGVTLFQRQGRRSVLTPAGRVLLEQGRELLAASQRLVDLTRETATGWEPRLRIAVEGIIDSEELFGWITPFLHQHPNVELDISEVILGGGWEALEQDRVDLVIGAPAPKPTHQGFRTEPLGCAQMVFVVRKDDPIASLPQPVTADHPLLLQRPMVVAHDTSVQGVRRSIGLFGGSKYLYVQTMEQKIAAQRAGAGVGRLPRKRVQPQLDSGELVEIEIQNPQTGAGGDTNLLLAWRISHKGKALKALVDLILAERH
jgi:DNA-binding transcriptional LysR family regulator